MHVVHVADIDLRVSGGGMNLVIPELLRLQSYAKSKDDSISLLNLNNFRCEKDKFTFKVIYKEDFNIDLFINASIVIFHSVYDINYFYYYKLCLKYNIPYVIVSHGGLAKTTIKRGRVKKLIYKTLFLDNFVNNAKALCFTSDEEQQHSLYTEKDYIIVPNPIKPHKFKPIFEKNVREPIDIVYLSKIDYYYKGLDLLFETLRNLKIDKSKYNINIYGYGENKNIDLANVPKYEKDVIRLLNDIDKLGYPNVHFYGPLYGDNKFNRLKQADIYILPSRSEAMPLSITEALSLGVPCIVTEGTNMGGPIKNFKCGWVADFEVDSLANALEKSIDEYSVCPLEYRKNAYDCYCFLFSKDIGRNSLDDYKLLLAN